MPVALKILRVAVIAYLVAFAALFAAQRKLLYDIDPIRTAPAAAGLPSVLEVEIATPDGERLIAWHGRAQAGQPTLLYLHGQSGTLASRKARIARFMNEGWGVFMLTWRGFGGSSGAPTEAHNVADATLAFDTLRLRGVSAADVVLYGESLGTGVAVQVATRRQAAGLVLDAPYTSTVDIAAERYRIFPVRLAMLDTYRSSAHIGQVHMPVLMLHGARDTIIPVRHGEALFALANEPKQLVIYPQGHHSDLYLHGALDTLRVFLRILRR